MSVDLQAIIFDMDGLMLDTERIALRVLAEAAQSLGYPWREEIGLAMVGLNSRDSDVVVRKHLGLDYSADHLREAFSARYEIVIATEIIPLKPGLLELLDWVESRSLVKAIATSTHKSRALFKLNRTGIAPYFDIVVGGDEVKQGKPAPEIFLAAAARLGVDPNNCLVLEDSAPGVRAALAAGMQVIMVPDMLMPAPEVLALGHPICISLFEAKQLIEKIFSTQISARAYANESLV
ncbi:MAG: HAD family phosphatase [Burkholderiales bacterium]